MKKQIILPLLGAFIAFFCLQSNAQVASSPNISPALGDAMSKIFGTNLYFSATMHSDAQVMPQNTTVSMTGKMYFYGNDSRTEMDMSKMSGSSIPPQALTQMKAMGMDKVVSIALNDQKTVYMIYPGLKAYAKIKSPDTADADKNVKFDITKLGDETVDGHPCTKTKYVITDSATGQTLTATKWCAKDMNNIPLKIEQHLPVSNAGPQAITMSYSDIVQTKPDSSLFTPPAGYTAYDDMRTMMQTEMQKKAAAMGLPQQ